MSRELVMRSATHIFGMAGPALCAALLGGQVLAAELKLRPVDEGARDQSFASFRAALLEAVRQRDVESVVSRASPEIKLSFGGDVGRETFREGLEGMADWGGEPYWRELERVLELGGVFQGTRYFCTPYISCVDVPGCPDCDPYETMFTLSDRAVAHAAPDPDSRVVAELSHDVLKIDYDAEFAGDWTPVVLPDGSRGYVSGPDFRMSIDYRALFEKVDGRWRMTVFIAGD